MAEYINNMRTQVEIGAEMFTSMMSNMESALDRFVTTGKLSFKDLTRSIIQDLIRIQMRAQMTGLFSMMFKSMGFGVGGKYGPDNIDVGGGWNPARADGYNGTIIRTYVVAAYDGSDVVAYAFNARGGGMNWDLNTNAEGKFTFTLHPVGGNEYGWSNDA